MKYSHQNAPYLVIASLLLFSSVCADHREASSSQELQSSQQSASEQESMHADPVREALRPVLQEIYGLEYLPDVEEVAIQTKERNYEVTAGALAKIRILPGLSPQDKAKAIVLGTAEADAWIFRKESRSSLSRQLHKLKYSFSEEQKQHILAMYPQLKLLSFFSSEKSEQAIQTLEEPYKSVIAAMRKEYLANKMQIWEQWMGIKLYARRVVASDEPFRSVLAQLHKDLGQPEDVPRSWKDSVPAVIQAWVDEILAQEELFILLTNFKEARKRVEFAHDCQSLWFFQKDANIPEEAKNIVPDPQTGFAVMREDLGGGYNKLIFVLANHLHGDSLKRVFVHTLIYSQLLQDFHMLATAGGDFAVVLEDGSVEADTAIVPDDLDPLYAHCGSKAALDTLLHTYGPDYPFLRTLASKQKDSQLALKAAHQCILEGARGRIKIPAKDDPFDVEGPAPASRLALMQMLARFEKLEVDFKSMAGDGQETQEDQRIQAAQTRLKELRKNQAASPASQ